MMTLVENYEEIGSHFKLDSESYLDALNDALVSHGLEDAQCHGRLLVMQEVLCQLVTNRDSCDQSLARVFYAKDIMVLRNKEANDAGYVEVLENPPSSIDIKAIILARSKDSCF